MSKQGANDNEGIFGEKREHLCSSSEVKFDHKIRFEFDPSNSRFYQSSWHIM